MARAFNSGLEKKNQSTYTNAFRIWWPEVRESGWWPCRRYNRERSGDPARWTSACSVTFFLFFLRLVILRPNKYLFQFFPTIIWSHLDESLYIVLRLFYDSQISKINFCNWFLTNELMKTEFSLAQVRKSFNFLFWSLSIPRTVNKELIIIETETFL